MFKRKDDDDISLSDARERMRKMLGTPAADVTTTCIEPGSRSDERVVRGARAERAAVYAKAIAQAQVTEPEPIPTPTRRDVLAALSNLLALCRAVGINERKDVAEIEIGLAAVFNEATSQVHATSDSALPKSRRLSEQFESDVN